MAPQSTKRAGKSTTSFKPAASAIPTPFEKAPPSLQPFLDRLDPSKVYITHIDRHLTTHKQNVFLAPIVINSAVALLVAYRIYIAAPTYLALLQTLLGYTSSATVSTTTTTLSYQLRIILTRTLTFLLDFLLLRFIAIWPLTFFLERPANPCTWRCHIGGFLPAEIIVRVSRHWGADDLMAGVKQGDSNPFFKTRILPAIAPERMQKTGYLLMDNSWDLEFQLMQDAHTLTTTTSSSSTPPALAIEDLDHLILVHQEINGWLAWRWESADDAVEARRKKIVLLKDVLTKMGRESLFWKWMEIVEDERDGDGGFSAAGQKRVAKRVQREFEAGGVDFEECMAAIGGMGDMPLTAGERADVDRLGI